MTPLVALSSIRTRSTELTRSRSTPVGSNCSCSRSGSSRPDRHDARGLPRGSPLMASEHDAVPDGTAERVALWRAMHLQVDAPPPVFTDEIGLQLAAPDEGWQARPD